MKKYLTASLFACLLAAAPASADVPDANCFVRARPDSSQLRLLYDPFAGVQATDELKISFTPRQKGCAFGLAIGGLGSSMQRQLQGNGRRLTYELQMRGSVLRNDLNQPSLTFASNPGQGRKGTDQISSPFEDLIVMVPSAQFAPAGTYRDDVTLRLFQIVNGVPQQTSEDVQLSIVVDIPARAQINLAGTSSPIFGSLGGSGLDFGQLEAGKERQAYLQVRATAPVMLTLTSENASMLRHRSEKTGAQAIPYSLSVDNQVIDLSKGPKRIDRTPSQGLGAENYRMVARILDVRGRIAGEYEDVITITVEPR